MHYTHTRILPFFLITLIALLPLKGDFNLIHQTTPTGTAIFSNNILHLNTAEARCGSTCKRKRLINKIWRTFLSHGGPNVGLDTINFGGTIADSLLCHNGVIAFVLAPSYGSMGPYGVDPITGDLYRNYTVMPGFKTVGRAPGLTSCVICIGSVCLAFPVQKVTDPGMGTS